MISEAYWSGDRETLRDLCDDDSYDAFVEAIEAREARGEKLENRLMRIDSAKITAVDVARTEARITVRYQADIQRDHARCRWQADRRVDERRVADRRSVELPPGDRQPRPQLAARRNRSCLILCRPT